MSLINAVLEIHGLLEGASAAHAFGGALALAQYAEPRATVDIDVNVFAAEPDQAGILDHLATLGYSPELERAHWVPIAGVRLRRDADPYPLDLFLPLGPEYEEIAARTRTLPFGPDQIGLPFLSPEDLTMFKLSFGRDKDWVDIRQIVRSGLALDVDYVERQLISLRGSTMYPRMARLRALVD